MNALDANDVAAIGRIKATLDSRLRGILDANDGVARVRVYKAHAPRVVFYLERLGYTVGSHTPDWDYRTTIEIEG